MTSLTKSRREPGGRLRERQLGRVAIGLRARRRSSGGGIVAGARGIAGRCRRRRVVPRASSRAAGTRAGSIGLPSRRISKCSFTWSASVLPISAIFWPLRDLLAFLHQDLAVVRVRGQVRLVVLDDDELAVAAQAGAGVDDLARGARDAPAGPAVPAMSMPFRFAVSEKPVDDLALGRPDPVELVVVVAPARGAARLRRGASAPARRRRRRGSGDGSARRRPARRGAAATRWTSRSACSEYGSLIAFGCVL